MSSQGTEKNNNCSRVNYSNYVFDSLKFGKLLRKKRKEQNLTQEELAHISGMGASTLSHLENGTCQPTIKTLVVLSSALKLSPLTLLFGNYDVVSARENELFFDEFLKEQGKVLLYTLRSLNPDLYFGYVKPYIEMASKKL